MKILVVSPYVPHPLCGHGGGVFMYGMVGKLLPRNRVTLLTFCDKSEERFLPDLRKLGIDCHIVPRVKDKQTNILTNLKLLLLRGWSLCLSIVLWEPYYVSKFRHRLMSRRIRELTAAEKFDVVQIEFTQMARYLSFVHSGRTFLHELDVSYRPAYRRFRKTRNPFRKFLAYLEWCRWAKYEPRLGKQFDRLLSVTDQDARLLDWLTGKKTARYFPHAVEPAERVGKYEDREPYSMVFMGTYSHTPNTDAARWLCTEIFPRIRKQYPQAKLYVIGPAPPKDLTELSSPSTGIVVTGFVDSVESYISKCRVFVAPLRYGGGIKNKVLVAMAQGTPVVTTKVGIEGVDGVDAGTALVADDPDKLADHVCSLFANPVRAAEIGMAGWNAVRKWYSWESIMRRLEDIYAETR